MTAPLKIFRPEGAAPAHPSGPTVADVVRDYLAWAIHFLGPRAYESRTRYLGLFAADLGLRPVAECRPSDLELWLAAHPAWASAWTVRTICAAVQRCFAWAARDRRIAANPFAGVTRREGEPRRALTAAEFGQLLRHTDPPFRRVLIFLRLTGCRPCEMRELGWDQVDVEADLWGRHPVIVVQRHKTSAQTRQSRPRVIRLVPVVVQLLLWLRRQRPPADPAEVVFRNSRGTAWTRGSLSRRLQALRLRTGLPLSAQLYGVRHQFATAAAVNGVPLATLAQLLGHASARTTEKYYVHLESEQAHLAEAMARAVERPPGGGGIQG